MLEILLRIAPFRQRRLELGLALRRQRKTARAAVFARADRQQAIALQGPDRTAQGGAVHHHRFRQFVDRNALEPVEVGQHRKLRRPQALLGQMAIVNLRDVPRRLAQREAIAGAAGRRSGAESSRCMDRTSPRLPMR